MKGTQKVPLWMDRIMGFFDWIFRKKRKTTEEINEEEVEYEDWDALELRKEDFRMEDTEQREKYGMDCRATSAMPSGPMVAM